MWKTGHSLIKAKMKELDAPLAGEMSGHMFFGGDYLGFDDALFAAARLLEIVSRQPFGLARAARRPAATSATPEIRVDVPEEREVRDRRARRAHFAARYPGEHHRRRADHLPRRLGAAPRLQHPADPGPALRGLRSSESLDAARSEVVGWLAGQGVRA